MHDGAGTEDGVLVKKPRIADPNVLRQELATLLEDFADELAAGTLRSRVRKLIPAEHLLRSLGSSLVPGDTDSAARDRILTYFRTYPRVPIPGEEIAVVAGISEWARRIRELRVQFGYQIITGKTSREMVATGELPPEWGAARVTDYILVSTTQDIEAAFRWNTANSIRKQSRSVRDRLLLYLQEHVGREITGEELRYVAKNSTEWARRVRELRTELGWPVVTRTTGRPSLPVGVYVLESLRQLPVHDRKIPDDVRVAVLERDDFRCQDCGWTEASWKKSDPRNHLELHHKQAHAKGGGNTESNLLTLCNVCHDQRHSSGT